MGIPELLYGVAAVILLIALIYAATKSGGRNRSPASDAATKRNLEKAA